MSPPAAATHLTAEAATHLTAEAARAGAEAGEASGRPLKRLRKAGQSEASLSSAAKPSAAYGE